MRPAPDLSWLRRHLAALEIMAAHPPTPCTIEEAREMDCFDSEEEALAFVAYSEAEDYDAIHADTLAGIEAIRWALDAAADLPVQPDPQCQRPHCSACHPKWPCRWDCHICHPADLPVQGEPA